MDFTREKEVELFGLHDNSKRKAAILAMLDKEIMNDDIADEIEASEKVQESIYSCEDFEN